MSQEANIPNHVAIIMDGNGRWAQERGKERVYGHINGVESVRNAVKAALRNGVRYLTIYVFSTENWGRPKEEVDALMDLLCKSIVNEAPKLKEQGVSVDVIGNMATMSDRVKEHIAYIRKETADSDKLTLIMALNYSSRWEITSALQYIARAVETGAIKSDKINSELISSCLSTAAYPDPDLLIRTSGERRLSNFLLWQMAYTELYFTDVYWPQFDQEEFDKAIDSYKGRQRRYGLTQNSLDVDEKR